MKQHKALITLYIFIAFFSCKKNEFSDGYNSGNDSISVEISPSITTPVKSGRIPEQISDANIFVFDHEGLFETHKFQSNPYSTSLIIKKGLTTIVVILNMGELNSTLFPDVESLRSYQVNQMAGTNGNMIFSGDSLVNVSQTSRSFSINVKRLLAKLTFIFNKTNLDPGITIDITNIALKNVPASSSLLSANTADNNNITIEGDQVSSGELEPLMHNYATPLYMPENLQGNIGVNNNPADKHPGTKENICSYVEITAQYSSPSKSGIIRFRNFPGLNNTNNYDIMRGVHYMETVKFNGTSINEISWRVDVSGLTTTTYSITASADPAGSGTISGTGQYEHLQIPDLQVVPATGFKFKEWIPPLAAATGNCHYTAMFEPADNNVQGVSVSPQQLEMKKGNSYQLTANIIPSNADNKNVFWSSSNTNIVSVNPVTGMISANGPGFAIITVTTQDGGFVAICQVTVYDNIHITTGKHLIEEDRDKETGLINQAIMVIYCRAHLTVPSDMQIINSLYPYVFVNVNYNYTDGSVYSGTAQLRLDLAENNDYPWIRTNGYIAVVLQGPLTENYVDQVFESLTVVPVPNTIFVQGKYVTW